MHNGRSPPCHKGLATLSLISLYLLIKYILGYKAWSILWYVTWYIHDIYSGICIAVYHYLHNIYNHSPVLKGGSSVPPWWTAILGLGVQRASVLSSFMKVEATEWAAPKQGAQVWFGRSKKNAHEYLAPWKNHLCCHQIRTRYLPHPNVWRSKSAILFSQLELMWFHTVYHVYTKTLKSCCRPWQHSDYTFLTCQFKFIMISCPRYIILREKLRVF